MPLPSVSRRSLLTGAATVGLLPETSPALPSKPSDPVLPLRRNWHRQYAHAVSLSDHYQKIEAQLLPALRKPGLVNEAQAHALENLEHQQLNAWAEAERAAEALFAASATSLAGIEAKLAVIAKLCVTGSGDPDFPLQYISSVLTDVRGLRNA
jgi:hypothetical protein